MDACLECKVKTVLIKFSKCQHSICRPCLKKHCEKDIDFSHCFNSQCSKELCDLDFKNNLDVAEYNKFKKRLKEKSAIKPPKVYWNCSACSCSNFPIQEVCHACLLERPETFKCPEYYVPSPEEMKMQKEEARMQKENQQVLFKETNKKVPTAEKDNNLAKVSKCSQCQKINEQTIILENCSHGFCSTCVMSRCDKKNDYSRCPMEGCLSKLRDLDFRKMLSDAEYTTFEKKLKEYPKNIQRPKVHWTCEVCSFDNLPLMVFCDACQSNRPETFKCPEYYLPSPKEKKMQEEEARIQKEEEQRLKKEEEDKLKNLERLKELTKEEVTMTQEVSECPICMMEYEAGEAIILHSCLHTICRDCFKNYLVNTETPKIKCPTENCIGQIEDREIQKMLTAAEYENYQQLSLRTAEATETLSFHCKGVNCTAWIVHDDNLKNFQCPLCKKENCIKCQAIHQGMSCADYSRSKNEVKQTADEAYFENLIKAGEAMLCPGCKCLIEKDKGCDWIRCKLCRTEICWATKGPRWGPKGHGDKDGGCRCGVNKMKCHPSCRYCH